MISVGPKFSTTCSRVASLLICRLTVRCSDSTSTPPVVCFEQHDYTAEAFGSSAKAANVVLEHKIRDAIPFPHRRRVTPRAPDGTPRGGPTLIWIEIDDWSIR